MQEQMYNDLPDKFNNKDFSMSTNIKMYCSHKYRNLQ